MTQRRTFIKRLATVASGVALSATLGLSSVSALAADTIKVGVLHSLSGTMAISETVLKDVTLMAIDEINAKGGVLGKKLEAVVVDPASNWPLFAEKARQLITQDKAVLILNASLSSTYAPVIAETQAAGVPLLFASSVCPNTFNTEAPKTCPASAIMAAGTFDAPPMITFSCGAGVDWPR